MSTIAFALKPDGPKELELDVSTAEVVVRLKGKEISRFAASHLQAGYDVKLPDGAKLNVRRKLIPPELVVTKDGVALAGAGADPEAVLEQVWKQTAGWAAVYAIWGGVTLVRADSASVEPQGFIAFGVAAALAVLSALSKKRWYPAIAITAAVFTGYLAWFASARSLCTALPFLIFPLWYLWAFRLISRSAGK